MSKCLLFLDTGSPFLLPEGLFFGKLIPVFRPLGNNSYPFESEPSLMLYQNAWYFWRQEPPFLLPECLFLPNQILVSAHFKRMQRHLCLVSVNASENEERYAFIFSFYQLGIFSGKLGIFKFRGQLGIPRYTRYHTAG